MPAKTNIRRLEFPPSSAAQSLRLNLQMYAELSNYLAAWRGLKLDGSHVSERKDESGSSEATPARFEVLPRDSCQWRSRAGEVAVSDGKKIRRSLPEDGGLVLVRWAPGVGASEASLGEGRYKSSTTFAQGVTKLSSRQRPSTHHL
ncbi:hypothetical protein C0Q70_19913 [Pomacea canaliculata]|uniref:Uncharacterized protein n=1 Tax=Pomacea canaliculata TaxID=400727 RepID=A0A2T7NE23_POMCA|nr:hypothetical protein C0Q70_19913 [Pomacea canaliculata]